MYILLYELAFFSLTLGFGWEGLIERGAYYKICLLKGGLIREGGWGGLKESGDLIELLRHVDKFHLPSHSETCFLFALSLHV